MASVREIARKTGVSAATVSRALNNDPRVTEAVREKILAAANRVGYVAKVGRRSTSYVAFVYTADSSLGSPFDMALLQGMGERMDDLGFDLVIINAEHALQPGETYSQMFMRKGIRGAVLRAATSSHETCEQIAAEGFPAVVVGERFESDRMSFIYADSRASSREAIEHLLALGHKRIAVCVNSIEDTDHLDRIDGYRDALAAAGMEFDERLVFRAFARLDGGQQVIRRLKVMPNRPTAVYFADPMAAVGAMGEARRLEISVPGELSVVGFDDSDLRSMVYPKLSVVCQDARAIGREAFEVVHQILQNPGSAKPIRRILPTVFEVNGSTGAPRKK